MNPVDEQKKRERLFREREIPFGAFTVREKSVWWNRVELASVFDALEWQAGGAVLDIGASDGRMLAYIRQRDPSARLTGVDFAVAPLQALRASLRGAFAVCADAVSPVFKPGTFDRGVSLQVLQQIPSDEERRKAIRNACAVLKPGGIFVVTVLNRPWWKHLVADGKEGPLLSSPELYVYLYDPQEICHCLVEAGFTVLRHTGVNNLPARYLQRLGWAGVMADRAISRFFPEFSAGKARYYMVVCQKK